MALIVADRVQETTNSTGTGAYTLGGAVPGFQTFASEVSNADTVYYSITDNVDFEVGLGTYASSGGTITRTTVFTSSNSNSAVNWGIGTKNIFLTYPADKAVVEDASNNVTIGNNLVVGGTVDGRDVAADGTKLDFVTVTQAVNLDQMETDIAALENGMVYKGDWNAGSGSFPGSGSAQTGWFYYVSGAGTVNGISFTVGDNIVATTDNASTSTYASNWSKHDQTDAVQAVVGLTGSIAKGSLLSALNVEDGADVTDTANVTSAGALMDSEVTNLAQVKAFNSSDYATAAQGTTANNALPKAGGTMTGDIDGNGNKVLFGNVYSQLSDLPSASTYHGMFAHVHATGKAYFAHSGAWVPLANESTTLALAGGTMTGNLSFGDNDKAIFGAELEIYSDATHARIREYGSGQLKIQGDNMQLLTSNGASTYLEGNASTSAVTLYHASNAPKLTTTSTGVQVSGNISNATGDFTLDVVGDIILDAAGDDIIFKTGGVEFGSIFYTNSNLYLNSAISNGDMVFRGNDGGSAITALTLDMSEAGAATFNSNIKTQALLQSIGADTQTNVTSSQNIGIHLQNTSNTDGNFVPIDFYNSTGFVTGRIGAEFQDAGDRNTDLYFATRANGGGLTERMRIDSSGNVIHTGGSNGYIQASGTDNAYLRVSGASANEKHLDFYSGTTKQFEVFLDGNQNFVFRKQSGNEERMRIDSSGNLLVGKTSLGISNAGHTLAAGGYTEFTRTATSTSTGGTLNVGRNSYDGQLATFWKDGTTVGSIGTEGGYTKIIGGNGSVGSGLGFFNLAVNPRTASGAVADGTISLGEGSNRFKDLYLSDAIRNNSGNLTLDASGDINLDADGGDINFKDGGTTFGFMAKSNNDLLLGNLISDGDVLIRGNDGGSNITALTFDMSEAGEATFNGGVRIPGFIKHVGDDNTFFGFPGGDEFRLETAGLERMSVNGGGTTFNEDGEDLDFRVESNGQSSMLFVDGGNDRVGVGTSSPSTDFEVRKGVTSAIRVSGGSNTNYKTEIGYDNSTGPYIKAGSSGIQSLQFYVDNTSLALTLASNDVATFTSDVNAVNFNSTSDATLKTNVETLTGSLDAVKSLRGVSFDWIENGNSEIGVIAQEVEDVLPDVVNTNEDGIKSVKYGNIVAVLIEAMKEQQAQIDELKAQINS